MIEIFSETNEIRLVGLFCLFCRTIFMNSHIIHIAQNITETCQKYFQSFIAIEILPQHFCK